jgi:PAS domain S-box-containing protein
VKYELISQATIEYVSVSMEDILGYKPEELTGTSVYDIFHPEEIPYLREVH